MCDDCGGTCGEHGRGRRRPRAGDTDQIAKTLGALAQLNDTLGLVHGALKTANGMPLLGARVVPIPGSVNGAAASSVVSSSPGRLAGFGLAETAGVGATIRLHDGTDTSGDVIMRIDLAANESAREWYMPHGIGFTYGLFVEIVSGAIEGSVYLGPR